MNSTESLWSATAAVPSFPAIAAETEVDVAIIGGGITGLTAALLLAEAGQRVVLVEARTLGSGVSQRSTTHLTAALDTRYFEIESDFGAAGAALVAQSSTAAIERVAATAAAHAPAAAFRSRPGYLYTDVDDDRAMIEKEHAAAKRAGLAVELLAAAPLPFESKRAVRFADQAQMHIQHYLAGVAAAARAKGAVIHEHSRVVAIEDGEPCTLHVQHGPEIRAREVFVATHSPLNFVLLQTKIAAYRSYILTFEGVSLSNDGLFWDTADPYHYFSHFVVDGTPHLLVGGEDHKTGSTTDTESRFDSLLTWARSKFGVANPKYRWSAQVEEPVDGLPFIGRNPGNEHVHVATGMSGNGTTFGTIAAMIMTDHVVGRANPWAELYAATRVKPIASAASYLSENVDFPFHLITDHLRPAEASSVDDVKPGEGKTVRVGASRLAVYREPSGKLHALSSVCPHAGCTVKFNPAEKSWDCPCHGSRFAVDGTVLDGPALHPLKPKSL